MTEQAQAEPASETASDTAHRLLSKLTSLPVVVQRIAERSSLSPEVRLQALAEYTRTLQAELSALGAA
jgi:hypothetical protein